MPRPLTRPMAECLALTIEHGGTLNYYSSGFWSWPGCTKNGNGRPVVRFREATVLALVSRDEMEITHQHRNWPIAAQVKKVAG